MQSHSSESQPPRLRGLDAGLMLGLLDDIMNESPPQIPGWCVSGVAGQGGSGVVWRAVRESDGALAAIKIASASEPETVERIEHEAAFLRSLQHPNIVKLLESGPLEQGTDEGGLYLAMEFIDGPAMVHDIPEEGLPPQQAYRWFRQIADAVAHAHDAGILHRDLKPANVLIAPDGHAKVADFGLARPVHRRIHTLSLTRAGLVAGTAEYLPPEAYHRDYQPDQSADIFALGVMLHEMLTGTPPRGAWQPASSRKGVDVRMDDIIRRAMHPDPAKRWPDANAMMAAIDEVLASPPRYSGTPLVTFPVRVADCLWTVVGLVVLLAGTSSQMHLEKSSLKLPLNLIGDHGSLTGGYHALSILLLASLPLSIWQLVRLRRFASIPLREALPSPFGLTLGHSRVAATLVAVCQALFIWLPALQMSALFLGCGLTWLRPDDPPWVHGLAVIRLDNNEIISPWAFTPSEVGSWLWESHGPPRHGLAKTVDRISFFPFISPLLMTVCAALLAVTLLATAWTACRAWWLWSRRARALALACLVSGFLILLGTSYSSEFAKTAGRRSPDLDDWVVDARMTNHLRDFAEFLIGARDHVPSRIPNMEWPALYQESVDYRGRGTVARREIRDLWNSARPQADVLRVEVTHYDQTWNPEDGGFHVLVRAVETFDGLRPAGIHGAADLRLELTGTLSIDGRTSITKERFVRTPMYQATGRTADAADAAAWADAFLKAAALAKSDSPEIYHELGSLFLEVPGVSPKESDSGWVRRVPNDADGLPALLGAELSRVSPHAPTILGTLSGGRTRIAIAFQSVGARPKRLLTADLVHTHDGWRCVKLAF